MNEIPEFSDLFLPAESPESGHMYPGPQVIPPSMHQFVNVLAKKAAASDKVDFAVNEGGVFFRGHKMPTVKGILYIFRRMPKEVWSLDMCGLPRNLTDYMLSDRLNKGGLIIIAGMPGNGKSTTCSAMIVGRLKEQGGLCITVEDPPEMPLQGQHGNGLCFQREVDSGEQFHIAVRDAMRGYPTKVNTMMLIGEVRDAETASLALRSSVDGRLVFITLHAGNAIQAVQRVISLTSGVMEQEEARDLLASGIRLVVHQNITNGKLIASSLIDTDSMAAIIRNKDIKIEALQNEIDQQSRLNKMKIKVQPREVR